MFRQRLARKRNRETCISEDHQLGSQLGIDTNSFLELDTALLAVACTAASPVHRTGLSGGSTRKRSNRRES